MKSIRRTFMAGLLATVPLTLTAFIMVWVFRLVTGLIPALLRQVPSVLVQDLLRDRSSALMIRILGLVVLVTLIFLVGLLTRSMVVRRTMRWVDAVALKLPMVRTIYATIQQFGAALLEGSESGMFKNVVMIEYPLAGTYVIGFVTASAPEECSRHAGHELVAVFVPTSPNPTSGFLLMVPREKVAVLEMDVVEGMRLVISGGAVRPGPAGLPTASPESAPAETIGSREAADAPAVPPADEAPPLP